MSAASCVSTHFPSILSLTSEVKVYFRKFVQIMPKNQHAKFGFDMLNGFWVIWSVLHVITFTLLLFHSFIRTDSPTGIVSHRGAPLLKTIGKFKLKLWIIHTRIKSSYRTHRVNDHTRSYMLPFGIIVCCIDRFQ